MKWGVFSTGGVIYYGLAGQIPGWKRLSFLSNRNSRNQFSPLLLSKTQNAADVEIYPNHRPDPSPYWGEWGLRPRPSHTEMITKQGWGCCHWSWLCGVFPVAHSSVEMNYSENIPKLRWSFDCNFTKLYINLRKSNIFMTESFAFHEYCASFHLFDFYLKSLNKKIVY